MIVVRDVSKWFGDVVAVNGVTFGIRPGVTALLGPNGAGKSTILRLLCGLTGPSRGSVEVLGVDPKTDLAVTRRIGLAPQQEGVFEVQTALEFVRLAAVLHGLPAADTAATSALELVEMDPYDRRPLGTYSKGMRQRVKLAQALVHEPDVLLLDEPLTGLDPRRRLHLIDLVHRLGEAGTCVVVSSHVLEEVERFGSRVLVMAQGRLAAEGDFRAIRELMDDRPHRIRIRSDRARAIATGLLEADLAVGVRLEDAATVVVDTTEVQSFRRDLAGLARGADARLVEVQPLDDDLESVFRYIVGSP
jgi:ABC-2 type transport system ATP-binding protein